MKRLIALILIVLSIVYTVSCGAKYDIVLTQNSFTTTEVIPAVTTQDIVEEYYILNVSSKKIHMSSCYMAKRISEKNRAEYRGDISELSSQGYEKCKTCFK